MASEIRRGLCVMKNEFFWKLPLRIRELFVAMSKAGKERRG